MPGPRKKSLVAGVYSAFSLGSIQPPKTQAAGFTRLGRTHTHVFIRGDEGMVCTRCGIVVAHADFAVGRYDARYVRPRRTHQEPSPSRLYTVVPKPPPKRSWAVVYWRADKTRQHWVMSDGGLLCRDSYASNGLADSFNKHWPDADVPKCENCLQKMRERAMWRRDAHNGWRPDRDWHAMMDALKVL